MGKWLLTFDLLGSQPYERVTRSKNESSVGMAFSRANAYSVERGSSSARHIAGSLRNDSESSTGYYARARRMRLER